MATSYECGVADTEARLTDEVAAVCRDYITLSWGVALDRAAVPIDSDLRKIENIFFPWALYPSSVASPFQGRPYPLPILPLASSASDWEGVIARGQWREEEEGGAWLKLAPWGHPWKTAPCFCWIKGPSNQTSASDPYLPLQPLG